MCEMCEMDKELCICAFVAQSGVSIQSMCRMLSAHLENSATSSSTFIISSTLPPSLSPSEIFPSLRRQETLRCGREKNMRSDRVLSHRSAIAAVSATPKASSDTPLESRNSPVNPSNSAQNSRWSASCSTAEQLLGLRLARKTRKQEQLAAALTGEAVLDWCVEGEAGPLLKRREDVTLIHACRQRQACVSR